MINKNLSAGNKHANTLQNDFQINEMGFQVAILNKKNQFFAQIFNKLIIDNLMVLIIITRVITLLSTSTFLSGLD